MPPKKIYEERNERLDEPIQQQQQTPRPKPEIIKSASKQIALNKQKHLDMLNNIKTSMSVLVSGIKTDIQESLEEQKIKNSEYLANIK